MRIPENLCMLLPKALKMRAIKHTMALITDSIGGTIIIDALVARRPVRPEAETAFAVHELLPAAKHAQEWLSMQYMVAPVQTQRACKTFHGFSMGIDEMMSTIDDPAKHTVKQFHFDAISAE